MFWWSILYWENSTLWFLHRKNIVDRKICLLCKLYSDLELTAFVSITVSCWIPAQGRVGRVIQTFQPPSQVLKGKYIFRLSVHSVYRIYFAVLCLHFCLFVCLFCVLFLFWDRISLCHSDCPTTHAVYLAGIELTEIHLPLLP